MTSFFENTDGGGEKTQVHKTILYMEKMQYGIKIMIENE